MAFQFPWTNLHELNLDWFLSKFKQFTNNYLATTATAESVPNGTPPSVTVTGGDLDDDTDIVDPFTFNFKIPAGQPGEQGEQGVPGVPGQDGFSPIATVTKSGTVATITITDVNGTTSTTISDGEVTQEQLDTKAPVITDTVTGAIANFPDGADDMPLADLVVNIEPKQSGSGDPSPSNIRPISGWTGCNAYRTGKNLLPKVTGVTNVNGLTSVVNADGSLTVTGTATGTGGYITEWVNLATTIAPQTYITVSTTTNVPAKLRCFWDDKTADIQSGSNYTTRAFSSALTKVRLYLFTTANTSYNFTIYPQVELGSTATAYEPYQGTTVNVDWTTEAGTVYGGTLDVTSGLLTVDRVINERLLSTFSSVGDYTNTIRYRYVDEFFPSGTGRAVNDSTAICNIAPYAYNSTDTTHFYLSWNTQYSTNRIELWVPKGTATTTPVQICAKLREPLTYQLTPQQLFNTLYGVNNVWSDTGDSTVTYTADTKLYIEQLTQPTEDDMIANTSIANGKFFMISNNLYRATTAIASGSQIIPGTNATPLSLADALNLL